MESFKYVQDTSYFWLRGLQKCGYFFENLNFPHILDKWKFLLFQKIIFFIKNYGILSIYFKYECLQLKITKFANNASEKTHNFFLNLWRVLRGELTLAPQPANSKRFRPAVMAFMSMFKLLCMSIPSIIVTEITTQIALRCGTRTLHIGKPIAKWQVFQSCTSYTCFFYRQFFAILSLSNVLVHHISHLHALYSKFEEYDRAVCWHSWHGLGAVQRVTMRHDATRRDATQRDAAASGLWFFLR